MWQPFSPVSVSGGAGAHAACGPAVDQPVDKCLLRRARQAEMAALPTSVAVSVRGKQSVAGEGPGDRRSGRTARAREHANDGYLPTCLRFPLVVPEAASQRQTFATFRLTICHERALTRGADVSMA